MQLEGKIKDIYDVFCNRYGGHNIDIQEYDSDAFDYRTYYGLTNNIVINCKYFIMVHWDEVEVTNEKNRRVKIWDVYSIIYISEDGVLLCKPEFSRSTYDNLQFTSGYVHSHLYSRDLTNIDTCREFSVPCFGSGPILGTIEELQYEYDIDMWALFCWELDKFLHVESLTGGPYVRMENISNRSGYNEIHCNVPMLGSYTAYRKAFINKLTEIVVRNKVFSFAYVNGHYIVNNDDCKTILAVSDTFIKEYNNSSDLRNEFKIAALKTTNIIMKAYYGNNKLYKKLGRTRESNGADIEGSTLFLFKGNEVKLKIINKNEQIKEISIVNPDLVATVLYNIQKFINVNYGREEITNEENAKII